MWTVGALACDILAPHTLIFSLRHSLPFTTLRREGGEGLPLKIPHQRLSA